MAMNEHSRQHAVEMLREHLHPLLPFWDDPDVQELMLNNPNTFFIERKGQMERIEGFSLSNDRIDAALNIIANLNDKDSTHIMDARMPGIRVAAARTPTAMHGSSMCIRKHTSQKRRLIDYERDGSFDVAEETSEQLEAITRAEAMLSNLRYGGSVVTEFLSWVVETRLNVIVSGATSAGKTTLLNAMGECIPDDDRVVTIEDTAELQPRMPNFVSFETNPALGVSIRDLVRLSLRYRPTRIIVGEVRGAEAFDVLDALNTGHPGSQLTYHSETSAMALARLESMIRMAQEAQNWPLADLRRQIAGTFKFIVHAQRVGGQRGPQEIRQILGAENGVYQTRLLFSKVKREDAAYE
jgi:pilus assembly protein CpaF